MASRIEPPKRVKRGSKWPGIPPYEFDWVTWHTFRRSYATWMRRYGGLDDKDLVDTNRWRGIELPVGTHKQWCARRLAKPTFCRHRRLSPSLMLKSCITGVLRLSPNNSQELRWINYVGNVRLPTLNYHRKSPVGIAVHRAGRKNAAARTCQYRYFSTGWLVVLHMSKKETDGIALICARVPRLIAGTIGVVDNIRSVSRKRKGSDQ